MSDITISAETLSRIWLAFQVLTDIALLMAITSAITAAIVHNHHTRD